MHKRGQITVFVILGILIAIVIAALFFIYGEQLKFRTAEETKFDASNIEAVKNFVEDCISKNGLEAINKIGKQGGEINPGFYQNWNCVRANECEHVSYACFTTEYSPCYNKKPFFNNLVENELTTYLNNKVKTCVDHGLEEIRESSGLKIETGKFKLNVSIGDYSTIVNLDYPLSIAKGETVLKQDKFSKSFDVPLGRLIKVAEDVVKMEINSPQGVAFYENYVLAQNGEIYLERQTYHDTEIYITKFRNNPYKFQFAIQNYVLGWP
jgi:hypothetical protein